LVQWTANVGAVWAGGLKKGQVVTCGSWTGKSPVADKTAIRAFYPSLGEASVQYS
jgi:2-keto-4-pentenoate hydratase